MGRSPSPSGVRSSDFIIYATPASGGGLAANCDDHREGENLDSDLGWLYPVTAAIERRSLPEAQHGGGKESSAPLHSAATAAHAPAPGVKLEDYVNECAVSVTAYPEARRGGGKKPSSALLPSAVALLPAPAPAPDLMLEDYVSKGVVSVTAHPEVRRGSGKRSSSARSPLSPAATVLALASGRSLKDYVKEWVARKVASGASPQHCVLPFLNGAPKAVRVSAPNDRITSG
ncbi:hypothetical protein TRIUR3_06975 [Triticum urartu]|uniref:Uncharacterized protein n=1 Tax=Triticum urartu TaxID=4572 RepID=M8ADJ3_TRIUA|nr:hypothetical protein TRIUR3_06975 [Triticum urartu]